jgi:hypothetical protein
MINNILLTAKTPSCRCVLCAQRRAVRLTQALQNKYCPAPGVID